MARRETARSQLQFSRVGFHARKGLVSLSLWSKMNAAMDAILIEARALMKYLEKGCGLAELRLHCKPKAAALMKVNHSSLPQLQCIYGPTFFHCQNFWHNILLSLRPIVFIVEFGGHIYIQ